MALIDNLTFTRREVDPPEAIDVVEGGAIKILWPGGRQVTIPALRLRDACPCAECIDEKTGEKLLDPASIPADIHPVEIHGVGNYAIQIQWSDGHQTGIYSWRVLRDVSGFGEPG